MRAIRGAITVKKNDSEEILRETKTLLKEIFMQNNICFDDIISIFFTTTKDLDAVFPAVAARELGLKDVALMCGNEMNVVGSLKKCIRVLVNINTEKTNSELKHIYLKGSTVLRPDLSL